MSLKHRAKVLLRESYARVLFHTGLWALVDRVMPPRLTILAGHCVAPGARLADGHLPADMQITEARLERILAWFGRRFELVTVGEGWRRVREGRARKSLVALSMDDGYRDNRRVMLPLLARVGAPATVYLESRPLDERRVNWSHKFFWLCARREFEALSRRYAALTQDPKAAEAITKALSKTGANARYHVKRALKYDVDPADRDRVIDLLFAEAGGDERALCDELYMTWEEARELSAGGVELGGHTVNHVILSRCDGALAEREIVGGVERMRRELPAPVISFAYPWGRRWDFDPTSSAIVARAGFESAVTMHGGVNTRSSRPNELKRLAIADDAKLHLLAAEACGGFELLRRFGIDLSE